MKKSLILWLMLLVSVITANAQIQNLPPGTVAMGLNPSGSFRLLNPSNLTSRQVWLVYTSGLNDRLARYNDIAILKSMIDSLKTGGGGGSYTFNNGLTDSSGTVSLGGGKITKNVSLVTQNAFNIGTETGFGLRIDSTNSITGLQTPGDYVHLLNGNVQIRSDNPTSYAYEDFQPGVNIALNFITNSQGSSVLRLKPAQSTWSVGSAPYSAKSTSISMNDSTSDGYKGIIVTDDINNRGFINSKHFNFTLPGQLPDKQYVDSIVHTSSSGSGTTNYLTKWTGANTQGNSLVQDNGVNVIIPGYLSNPYNGQTLYGLGDSFGALGIYSSGLTKLGFTHAIDGISGSCITGGTGNAEGDGIYRIPFVDRISTAISNSPQMILIEGGSNDFHYNVPLGSVSSTDTTTFCGALNYILQACTTSGVPCRLITPTFRADAQKTGGSMGLANWQNMIPYVESMKAIAAKYSIQVIDEFYGSGINYYNSSYFTTDGVHPNNAAGESLYNNFLVANFDRSTGISLAADNLWTGINSITAGNPLYFDSANGSKISQDIGGAFTIDPSQNSGNGNMVINASMGKSVYINYQNQGISTIFGDGDSNTIAQINNIGVTANSFIKSGSTSNDILLGNGTTISKSALQSNIPIVVAFADTTNQTTANSSITTYMILADGTYRVGGYINITAITADVIEMQVAYTDENNNPQTPIFYSQGAAASTLLTSIGDSSFPTMDIRCKSGTAITLRTVLTVSSGTITYDVGATILKLR